MWRKGFTLIELIVVIAIIAILAAIIAPNAFKAIEKSKASATIGELQGMKTAALSYFADVGGYPVNCSGDACGTTASGFVTTGSVAGWDGPYLPKWPPASKFNGEYNWVSASSTRFNLTVPRLENYVEVNGTSLSTAVQNSLDKSIDGGGAYSLSGGDLRAPNANAVEFLVSRDGPVGAQ